MKHEHRPKQSGHIHGIAEYRSLEKKKLLLTISITGTMMVVEIIGGLLSRSLALISDAGHMFTHFFALAISLGAILFANKKRCHHRTFGFFRIEILSALLNSLFLFGVTLWIFVEAAQRLLFPETVLGLQMFIVAFIGLIVNLLSAWILHGSSHDDLNVRGAFIHMLADTLSSVVVVIGALIVYFTGWDIIDPILSIGIALVICVWGWELFKDSINILLESSPKGITSEDVSNILMEEIPAIKEITDIHVWVITSKMYSMTAHIKLQKNISHSEEREALQKIKMIVDTKFDIEHTTIEFE